MSTDPWDGLDRILAESIDQMLADDWEAKGAVLVLARSRAEDEYLETKTIEIDGHPYDTLRLLPADERYLAACLSTLGHTFATDSATPQRTRVRATIAVGRESDYSVIRQQDGKIDTLQGVTGESGDLMRKLIQGRCA